jgi:hypothetical protein
MAMSHPSRLAAFTVALLAVMLLPAATAAATTGTATPSLGVSPSSGLRIGQIVTVTGSDLPSDIYLAECEHAATSGSHCGNHDFAVDVVDGSVHTPMEVIRHPLGLTGPDCAKVGDCEIAVLAYSRGNPVLAAAGISFNPNAAPVVPHVSVTPSTGLAPTQWVTVTATGLAPLATVEIFECDGLASSRVGLLQHCGIPGYGYPDGGFRFDTHQTTDVGSLALRIRADANLISPFNGDAVANCEVSPGCEFVFLTSDPASPTFSPQIPITFNPAARPVTPIETVSATSDLANGQTVTVAGGPFLPGEAVAVRECPSATPVWQNCSLDDLATGVANAAGQASIRFDVVEKSGAGPSENCTTEQCSLLMVGQDDVWYSAWTPIDINPALPTQRPKGTVAPATGLSNGTLVTVTGSGFLPGAPLNIEECLRSGADCEFIGNSGTVGADSTGSVDFGAAVVSELEVFDNSGPVNVSCGLSGCMLLLVDLQDAEQRVISPIDFAS